MQMASDYYHIAIHVASKTNSVLSNCVAVMLSIHNSIGYRNIYFINSALPKCLHNKTQGLVEPTVWE